MIVAVTGAAGILGQAVCHTMKAEGWQVAGIDLASDTKPSAAEDIRVSGVDISNENQALHAMATTCDRLGRIDCLANLAGGFVWERLLDGSTAAWDRMWNVNMRTTLVATRSALTSSPGLKAIVNVSAIVARQAPAGLSAYAASKAGILRMTESIADELKSSGVRINAILPSIIDTPDNRRGMPDADFSSWVSPQEAAHVVAFLLSDKASAITGAAIPVCGRV